MELRLNKRFTDMVGLFFALAVIFGVAVFMLILFTAYDDNIKDKLNEALTSSTPVDANANVTQILDETGGGLRIFNSLFPVLIIGVFGFVLVSALMARSHPAFFFIGLIVLGVALTLAAIYSNVYESIAETENFSSTDSEFGITGIFLDNLPIVILVLFVGVATILYVFPSKSYGGGGI